MLSFEKIAPLIATRILMLLLSLETETVLSIFIFA